MRTSQVWIRGARTDALARSRYRARRRALARSLEGPMILTGIDVEPGSGEVWPSLRVPIWQDPLFVFLTGLNQTGAALWLHGTEEVLFLPGKNAAKEFWEGFRFGAGTAKDEAEAKSTLGIAKVLPRSSLGEWLAKKARGKSLFSFWHEPGPRSPKAARPASDCHARFVKEELPRLLGRKDVAIRNAAPSIWEKRWILDEVDVDNVRRANRVAGGALAKTLSDLPKLRTETEVRARLEAEMLARTPRGLAFPSIVAGGANAAVLHYEKADEPLPRKGLLLIDFGCRVESMCCDVTRTVPVSGRFNPLQRLLYDIVLEAMLLHEKSIRPGVTLKDANDATWRFLESELERRFLGRGGTMKRPYEKAPHGVSHLLGEAIHDGDPFGEYKHVLLRPGMLLSCEPGLYGEFRMRIDGKTWKESLGIRIEDDLLVTAKGCVNLTASIPRKAEAIEKAVGRRS